MPFIVKHLIQEHQNVITATEDMSVQTALERMFEYDFSQLPVIDLDRKLRGMITNDSILRAISHFGVTLNKLRVSHALVKVKPCFCEDELSELLNRLKDNSAIPVVDNNDYLIGIITNYDTTEYFRQRAEDLMLAEDIEITLRDLIEGAYKDNKGEINVDSLNEAIKEIIPSDQDFLKKFIQALKHYLQLNQNNASIQFDQESAKNAFNRHLYKPAKLKAFEELTLGEYIQLFKKVWEKYESDFNGIAWEALGKLLTGIRQTRNSIAHFREVTTYEREQLRFCTNLLNYHRPSIEYSEPNTSKETTDVINLHGAIKAHVEVSGALTVQPSQETDIVQDLQPVDEEINANDSRYAPLAVWLQNQVNQGWKIQLTFQQIEEIIKGELPPSARQHRAWWANDTVSHVQAQQWLDVGWRVANVNISEERVIFSQIDDRQGSYIKFFNTLLPKLQATQSIRVEPAMNLQGRHWFTVKITSEALPKPTWIILSFARQARFRVELYIETGDQSRNKSIFDALFIYKAEIETKLGELLSWERLNSRRASRVALYYESASITNSSEELAKLQDWASEMIARFYWAIAPYLYEVMCSFQTS